MLSHSSTPRTAPTPLPSRRGALASVKTGVLNTPVRVLIYGSEKVGKSTFAAAAPRPIFIGAESGTERLDVARLQPSSWAEAVEWVAELADQAHDYQTLVVDPVNWLEPMCWDAVTKQAGVESIEDVGGGFAKGYVVALGYWRALLDHVERCWLRGMHVVIVGHSQVRPFKNPEGAEYDRYELAMHPKAAALLKQWVDAVLFARLETFARPLEKKGKRAIGTTTGARVVHTEPSAAFDAGSRWRMTDPLPLSWDAFFAAVQADGERAATLAAEIAALTARITDPQIVSFATMYLEKHKDNADRLAELVNRLALKIDHQEETSP